MLKKWGLWCQKGIGKIQFFEEGIESCFTVYALLNSPSIKKFLTLIELKLIRYFRLIKFFKIFVKFERNPPDFKKNLYPLIGRKLVANT